MYYIEPIETGYWVRSINCTQQLFTYKTKPAAEQQCSYLNGGLHPTTQKALAKVLSAGLREIEKK